MLSEVLEAMLSDLLSSFFMIFLLQVAILILAKILFSNAKLSLPRIRLPFGSGGRTLPHPPAFPFIGNLLQLKNQPLIKLNQWSKKYGPIYRIRLGRKDFIVLNNHEVVDDLIVKRGSKYSSKYDFNNFNPILTNSNSIAFTPYGNKWKSDRSIAYSALTSRPIKSFYNYILRDTDQLVKDLMMKHGQSFYPLQIIKKFVLTNMLSVLFGKQIKGENDPFFKDVMNLMNNIAEFSSFASVFNDIMPALNHMYGPGPSKSKTDRVYEQMENIFAPEYDELLEAHQQGKELPQSFLLQIQEAVREKENGSMKYDDVWKMLVGLLNGAMETEVNTLMWTLACLANNPGVQEEAFKELDGACDRSMPTLEDEVDLPYINAIINETLRFRPPTAFGAIHLSSEDDEYNGYFIPKGTPVLLNLFAINHNERRFIAPDTFRPSRFMPNSSTGSVKTKSILLLQTGYENQIRYDKQRTSLYGLLKNSSPSLSNASMPMHMSFGSGRRYCIGQHLAQKQLFLALARILWAFEIRPNVGNDGKTPPEVDLNNGKVSLTSYSPSPYNVRFLLRKDIGLLLL